MRQHQLATLLFASSAWIALSPAIAGAQEAEGEQARVLDVISVTATKREQSVQEVPFTVQAVGAQEIIDSGAVDFSGIADRFAGVEFRTAQQGQGAIAIRGIAELNTDNINGGTGAAVGLYVDESPLTVAGLIPQAVLFDLQRVEVLKGPQGSLFGEGSLGGTVRLVTNKPDMQKFGATLDHSWGAIEDGGNNNLTNAMVNIPLVQDKLALRAVGFYYDQGGFIDRIRPNVSASISGGVNSAIPFLPNTSSTFTQAGVEKDADGSESHGGRIQLEWRLSDALTANLSALFLDADRGIRSQGTLDRVTTVSTNNERADDELRQYGLTLVKELERGAITSSTSYFDREIFYSQDQIGLIDVANDFVLPLAAFVVGVPEAVSALRADFLVGTKDFSQEIRYVSDFGGAFEYTVGAFYRDRDFTFGFTTPTEPAVSAGVWNAAVGGPLFTRPGEGDTVINAKSNTEQIALFGEATFDATERLHLLLGGRIFREERKSDSTAFGVFVGAVPAVSFSTSADETIFSPRASASYDLTSWARSYFTYSEGFRSGGQNDLNAFVPAVNLESYKSERLKTYELGLKSELSGGTLIFNAAAFYNDWKDLQVVLAEGPGGAGEVIGNAGNARSYGVDLEANWRPSDYLTVVAAATIMETDIRDSVLTVPNPTGVGPDIPVPVGTDIPRTAEQQFSLAATYRRPITSSLTGYGRASVAHIGDSLTSLTAITNATPQPPTQAGYTRTDARIGIEAANWAISLFANNLFDEDIILGTRAGSVARDFVTGDLSYVQGAPRTIGINLRVNY